MSSYLEFIASKQQISGQFGFAPLFMPDALKDFQKHLVEWALRKGRAALFADCGLGKTFMQLAWAQNVVQKTNMPVLVLTPLSVSMQTVREAEKWGMDAVRIQDGNIPPGARIIVSNYERLHYFDAAQFAACVCDESGCIKCFDSATTSHITEFMRKMPYRLLCTATPSPNDYIELGTSSEALGYLKRREMMAQFFNHDGGETSKWRLKKHAADHLFWRWVCSWARAVRKPSDLGFCDDGYELPELILNERIVRAAQPQDGFLFDLPAITLDEQRGERRRTITQRCEAAAEIAMQDDAPCISWCGLNSEGDMMEEMIPGAVQISGSDSDEFKEETFLAFVSGEITKIVTKTRIAGFGMNFQHCARQTFFPSHSFEEFYQAIRRSWRFGQERDVHVYIIASEGEARVLDNAKRKSAQADEMFRKLVSLLGQELETNSAPLNFNQQEALPSWL